MFGVWLKTRSGIRGIARHKLSMVLSISLPSWKKKKHYPPRVIIPAKYPDFFGIIPQFWMNSRDPEIPVDYPEIHCTRNKLDIVRGALQMTCHRPVIVLIDPGPP